MLVFHTVAWPPNWLHIVVPVHITRLSVGGADWHLWPPRHYIPGWLLQGRSLSRHTPARSSRTKTARPGNFQLLCLWPFLKANGCGCRVATAWGLSGRNLTGLPEWTSGLAAQHDNLPGPGGTQLFSLCWNLFRFSRRSLSLALFSSPFPLFLNKLVPLAWCNRTCRRS